jgi:GntR family transcriptional regulator, rspAB operon transcriptional repressor
MSVAKPKQSALSPLPNQTIADAAYAVLSERILNGSFKPGQRLMVKAIASQLHISPTPLKSALSILEREGLVTINPRSGTYVTPIDMHDLADVLLVRRALEMLAAESAIERATATDLIDLEQLVDKVWRSRNIVEHYQLNAQFHQRLVELSGNRTLVGMYRQLHAHLRVAFVHARSETWRDRIDLEEHEHRAITNAMKQRDRDAVQLAVDRHCSRTAAALVSEIRNMEQMTMAGQ